MSRPRNRAGIFRISALACLSLLPAAAHAQNGQSGETDLAAKLSREADDFLAALLGPSKAKVLIRLETEKSELRTQSEFFTPMKKPALEGPQEAAPEGLPGYTQKAGPQEQPLQSLGWDYWQKDQEHSLRQSGLTIKKMEATVLLDSGLPGPKVEEARRLLPEFLRMDPERGDELKVVRAALLPSWKSLLLRPEGQRALLWLAGAAALVLLAGLIAYAGAMKVVRAFVFELAARRYAGGRAMAAGEAARSSALPGAAAMPELLAGGIPTLAEEAAPGHELPALGRRFDFLASKEPAELARLLEPESAEDAALLLAYLADSNPDLAGALFAALPYPRQSALSQALVKLKMADPERLAMLESRLKTSVEYGLQGTDRLGRILSRLPPEQREGLVADLLSASPEAASEVEKSLFPFEELAGLKASDLRRLIMAAPYEEWGTALRGAPESLSEAILSQLLAGPRELVRQAMDTPAPRRKILEARSKIISLAQAMARRGQIALGREGASSELI